MLAQILAAIDSSPQPLCAETLASRLNKDASVIAAMLEELCLMGHIRLESGEGACGACRARTMCRVSSLPGPSYTSILQRGVLKEVPFGSSE
jgi:hypothetical protein